MVHNNRHEEVADPRTPVSEHLLEERAIVLKHPAVVSEVNELALDGLDKIASHDQIDAWDNGVHEQYPYMQFASLQDYMSEFPPNRTSFADYQDYLQYHGMSYGGARDVACAPNYYSARIARKQGNDDAGKPLECRCSSETVCELGDSSCIDGEEEKPLGDELSRRGLVHLEDYEDFEGFVSLWERANNPDRPRGGEERPYKYDFKAASDDTQFEGTVWSHRVSHHREEDRGLH